MHNNVTTATLDPELAPCLMTLTSASSRSSGRYLPHESRAIERIVGLLTWSGCHLIVDVLTPNQTEAAALTGIEVTDVASARAAAQALLDRGAAAVVKLGELGAFYASREGSGHVPTHQVEVVDTIAAGDAFGAALAVGLVEGRGMEQAVRYGVAAGALAVTRPGAQEAMPSRAEVEALQG